MNEVFDAYLVNLVDSLRFIGVSFDAGLSNAEVAETEETYGFCFPPDLRALLQFALPVSDQWVNWRDASFDASIRERLNWPADGICFDVENNGFWMAPWGERPADLNDAFAVARQHVAQAPVLIPICSHRYLPSDPLLAGNPVFSVYQTDIIYYGYDLAAYFVEEFGTAVQYFNPEGHVELTQINRPAVPFPEWAARSPRSIRFWDEFVDGAAFP